MFCKLNSFSLNGIDALPIQVEIDLQPGLPGFDIVGLPDSAVKEARERVKSAIKNSGCHFPICHITINLSPADIRKEGSLYDLPIALGILCCLGEFPARALSGRLFIGELALDGSVRGIRGVLPILCRALHDNCLCVLPEANTPEALLLHDLNFATVSSLAQLIQILKGACPFPDPPALKEQFVRDSAPFQDFSDVRGQSAAKRGLLLAAAGYHNTILIGPPGSGKTMLAQRLATIMPPLTEEECIQITQIYSVANMLTDYQMITSRPFRSPHHSITPYGLSGGGQHPRPGEISLAHLGVLFLDELLEFNRKSLEILRQPLESHTITLSRAQMSVTYPANFLFLASTNPCPCGYYPDSRCTCSMPQVKKYLSRLSGPLIDRIDIHLEVHTPSPAEIKSGPSVTSEELRQKVCLARSRQQARFSGTSILYNSQIPSSLISKFCPITASASDLLWQWFDKTSASIRAYDKVMRLALTICDVDGHDMIDTPQIAEALKYRILDYSLI